MYSEVRQLEDMRDRGLSKVWFSTWITDNLKSGDNIDELNAMEITYRGVQQLIEDFEAKIFALAKNSLALAQVKYICSFYSYYLETSCNFGKSDSGSWKRRMQRQYIQR